jgi:hypothetical protein
VQIKSDKELAGDLVVLKQKPKKRCCPFVIRFSDFTHLSDSKCADNAEHLSAQIGWLSVIASFKNRPER